MLTRKALLFTPVLGVVVLLAGCTTVSSDGPANPGVPISSSSASAGVVGVPTSGSATPTQVATEDSNAAGVQTPTTGGDDQRSAEQVVMSYFDNLLVGDSAKAARLVASNSGAADGGSASFVKQILSEKLVSYRVSGNQIDPSNGETIVRVHYSTKANPSDQTRDFATEEDQLESTWQIVDVNVEGFGDTSP